MKRQFVTPIIAALLAVVATDPGMAGQGRGHRSKGLPHMAREKPQVTYAGDCGPNPPPGYRWDLKGWRTGFSDRDFSCYILTGPN